MSIKNNYSFPGVGSENLNHFQIHYIEIVSFLTAGDYYYSVRWRYAWQHVVCTNYDVFKWAYVSSQNILLLLISHYSAINKPQLLTRHLIKHEKVLLKILLNNINILL